MTGRPPDRERRLPHSAPLEAARLMDSNERSTVIAAPRESAGKPSDEILAAIDRAVDAFRKAVRESFGKKKASAGPRSSEAHARRR